MGKDFNVNKAVEYAPPVDYSQHNPINDGNIVNVCEMPESNREFGEAMQHFEETGEVTLPASYYENLQGKDLNQANESTEQLQPGHQDINPFSYAEDLGGGFQQMREDENAREENNDLITAESEPKMADQCDPPLDSNEVGNDLNSSASEENTNDGINADDKENEVAGDNLNSNDSGEETTQEESEQPEQPESEPPSESEPPADTSGDDIPID